MRLLLLCAAILGFAVQPSLAMDFFKDKRLTPQTDFAKNGNGGLASVFEEGLSALEQEDYDSAVTAFNKLRRVAKRDAIVNYYLGVAKHGQGNTKAAKKYLQTAVRYGGDIPELRREYALVLIALEREDDAREQLSAVVNMMKACGDTCPEDRRLSIAQSGAAIAGALGLYDEDVAAR